MPQTAIGQGKCEILEPAPAWDGNHSHNAFTLLQWQRAGEANSFDVVVVNHSKDRSQCWARVNAQGLGGGKWILSDRLSKERHERDGDELQSKGLFLDTPAHAAQLFSFKRA